MFHRRRAASNPGTRAPSAPNSAATLAASQAFLKGRDSNASLSSAAAAAAAALRTHATSPTPVGDIQTKRMIRRGSTSSQGSNGSSGAPGLRRQSSSGSMSERTFRASSPNRSSPSVEADPNAPPVPAIPAEVPVSVAQKRASSLELPANFRGASHRRGGGRGVSVDRGMPAAGRGHAGGGSSLELVPEVERENSTRSINFSRPMSPPASPEPSPATRAGHSGWFATPVVGNGSFRDDSATRPKTADVSGVRNSFAQESIREAPEMPVHTNRVGGGVEGARLASGTMGARTRQTSDQHTRPSTSSGVPAIDPKSPLAVYDPSTRKFVPKPGSQTEYQKPIYHTVERPQSPPLSRPQSPPARQTPSTGFQTRAGALLARRSSEDYGEDDQQQSVPDANTSRSLDHSPQNLEERTSILTGPPSTPAQRNSSIRSHDQTPNSTLSAEKNGSLRAERPQSLSPGRAAHFSRESVELPNGIRHQPPPRSISPTKSALKQSPSSSIRAHSPVVIASRGPPSETSDAVSEEGSRSTLRRKKNVRVSFDDGPVIAGESAYAETSPTAPKGIETSKWSPRSSTSPEDDIDEVMTPRPELPSFGSIRERPRRADDDDPAEKVTETIPSSMSTSASTIAEPLEASSDHALAGIITNDFSFRKAAEPSSPKNNSLEPIPPEVTSVEGSGHVSDSDQSVSAEDGVSQPSRGAPTDSLATDVSSVQQPKPTLQVGDEPSRGEMAVPLIAVVPATPRLGEDREPKYDVPGGFPGEFEEENAAVQRDGMMTGPTTTTIAEPAETVAQGPTHREIMNQRLSQEQQLPVVQEQTDDSDDESSIYSDAAEDISDDEAQFASIDALVESPVVRPPRGLAISTPPDSPARSQAATANTLSPQERDWNAARDHWSGLNEAQRQNAQREADSTAREITSIASDVPILQPAKMRKRDTAPASATQSGSVPGAVPQQQTPAQPRTQPRKSALKNSMSQEESTAAKPHIRKTMRSDHASQGSSASDTHLKQSMRGGNTIRSGMRTEPGLAASRYSSPPSEPRGALQKRNIPSAPAPARPRPQTASPSLTTSSKALQMAPLGRTFSNDDSDASESSFKRERRKRKGANGERYSMRRSMRGAEAPASSAPAPTMRPQSAHVQAILPPPTMRTSMRPLSPTPTALEGIKSSRFSIRSLSPSGRGVLGKKSRRSGPTDITALTTSALQTQSQEPGSKLMGFGKTSKPQAPAPSKPAPRFQSRFADSSDEDDGRPTRFLSRFADSDEDDDYTLPAGLAPVRGIPRKPGDEDRDSTDLSDEDSSTERLTAASNKTIERGSITQPSTNGAPEPAFAATSLRKSKHADQDAPINGAASTPIKKEREKEKSKRGFFGLGKKKQPTAAAPNTTAAPIALPIPEPPPHTTRTDPSQQIQPTPIRPLTPIGEDSTPASPSSASPCSPRLQRRTTPQFGRTHSSTSTSAPDSWPLPQPPKVGEEVRPASSDGVFARPASLRPTLSMRRESDMSEARVAIDPKTGQEVVVGRTGRKKRFVMLRKAFGLHN